MSQCKSFSLENGERCRQPTKSTRKYCWHHNTKTKRKRYGWTSAV
jgi:hypothetical protein